MEPLVRGGQGRTAGSLERDASLVGHCLAVAGIIVALVWMLLA